MHFRPMTRRSLYKAYMPIFILEGVPFFLHIYTCGFYVYVRYSFFFRRPQPNCLPVTHTLINEHHVMLV